LVTVSLVGCGQPTPVLPPPPPHGGTAFALPEAKGFVEVLRQDTPDHAGQTKLVVYFLDADCKPLSAPPTSASFDPRGRNVATIALTPTADADPSKSGGLASAPFDDPGGITGKLSATIDSKPVSVDIRVR
jgi:hypothetical protein